MADSTNTPGGTPSPSNRPSAGTPTDSTTTGGMDASTEPEAQLASAMASPASPTAGLDDAAGDSTVSLPAGSASAASASGFGASSYGSGDGGYRSAEGLVPSRSDYEMPDDYANDWLTQTKEWVEANPALAVLAAAGIGLVLGRIVSSLAADDEPPTLSSRVERRAKDLKKEAKHLHKEGRGYFNEARKEGRSAVKGARRYAEDTGETIQEQLARAAEALSAAAGSVSHRAEAGYERSKDLAEVVADAAKDAFASVMAKKGDSWLSKLRD